ncbi:MAG: hypothetical protein JRH17_12630 [Deltaproteobacteria bacterium]|nr:hypothetical protein [Deltaproteobacteria bacterium]MBW2697707.1 hypothetical protein [Deltaproteobacteria bacterium]
MSAYLKFFELEQSPFDTRSQSKLVLGTKALRDAYAEIQAGIEDGSARICVSGGSGLGKTSLARALPKLLRDTARVVVLLNPALPWSTLSTAIVKQLDLEGGALSRRSLTAATSGGRRLILVIDAAERIARESLEQLDIMLAYQGDDDRQLMHCVMLANLERAGEQEECPLLWWLDSLHTLQLEFAPIPASGVGTYISKHLKRAGWKGGQLFTSQATQTIHRLTGGVPRKVSDLCEAVLQSAASSEIQLIESALVEEVAGEPPVSETPLKLVSDPYAATQAATRDGDWSFGDISGQAASMPAASSAAPEPAAPGEANADPPGIAASSEPGSGLDAFFGPADPEPASLPPPPPTETSSEPLPEAAAEVDDRRAASFETSELYDLPELTREDLLRRGRIRTGIAAAAALVLGVGLSVIGMQLFSADDVARETQPARLRAEPPLDSAANGPVDAENGASGATSPDADIQKALSASSRRDVASTRPATFEELATMEIPVAQADDWAEAIRRAVTGGMPPRAVAPVSATTRMATSVIQSPVGPPSGLVRQRSATAPAEQARARTRPIPTRVEPDASKPTARPAVTPSMRIAATRPAPAADPVPAPAAPDPGVRTGAEHDRPLGAAPAP